MQKLSAQDKADKGKQYEKEQRQRTYERRIRKTKREVLGMQSAVDNCKDEQAKFALQQDLDRKSYLLQKQNANIQRLLQAERPERTARPAHDR